MGDLSKRLIDAVASALLLVLLSPLVLVTPILVRTVMGSPVLFRQRRPGYLGRPFLLLKFRTMREATDRDGATLPDADRLSPLGRWLRRTSLDELPQLWNVLKGDMSLVGPRPLLMEYLPLYNRFEARRHEVRPGITGWAQVNGRNTATWPERFALDVYYVEHRSLWLDVRILLLTIWRVIRRDGISSAGEATMSKFTGSNG
jgi:lipopolysaccharide/colanic/teichoic acid biosynthesis glycosyltransferase